MQRKTVLYIAMSLDGYIADSMGGVSWLPEPEGDGGGYGAFIEGIDTILMGMATYRQIVEDFLPTTGPIPLPARWCSPTARRPIGRELPFCREDPAAAVRRLKGEAGKAPSGSAAGRNSLSSSCGRS